MTGAYVCSECEREAGWGDVRLQLPYVPYSQYGSRRVWFLVTLKWPAPSHATGTMEQDRLA
jgi:hypothetical protein